MGLRGWWSGGESSLIEAAMAYADIYDKDFKQGKCTQQEAIQELVTRIQNFVPDPGWDWKQRREFEEARDNLAVQIEVKRYSRLTFKGIAKLLMQKYGKANGEGFAPLPPDPAPPARRGMDSHR